MSEGTEDITLKPGPDPMPAPTGYTYRSGGLKSTKFLVTLATLAAGVAMSVYGGGLSPEVLGLLLGAQATYAAANVADKRRK